MKNLRTSLLCVCITLSSICAVAQKQSIPLNEPDLNKPLLFAAVPEKVMVNETTLARLFNNEYGSMVSIPFASGFTYQGQVVSNSLVADARITSVVIRSTNFEGSNLTISTVIDPVNGTVNYVGRIISLKHGDLLELQQVNGQYMFVKKKFYDLINE
jgi:hypothetical protein